MKSLFIALVMIGSVAHAKNIECSRSQALNMVKASQPKLYNDYLEMTHQQEEEILSFGDFKKETETLASRCADADCKTHGFSSRSFAEHSCQAYVNCRFYVDVNSCGPNDKAAIYFEIDPE
ncbi:hypothetical protein AZI86_11505 [Bdellovibrio bacteriovorus]|uniref:Uncharacterized protein n=1 Tax=Bdellovibrio bacteriovorus TaxID=959 RepID=A0A150WLQ8_BDEBC|nr:hypothetical protein [Bdellovibrio bacteriovorus]KYG64822.1 hypothetical protein AZI86_11505 [Bdellovibrio bacteriovorus]